MAYDPHLVDRTRNIFLQENVRALEKKMFGGVAFMVKGKMCVGVLKDDLMVRLDPDLHEKALLRKGCRDMKFTGKTMRGFVFVSPEGIDTAARLRSWVNMALEYNPKAQSSKKKKKKPTRR